MNNLSIFFFIFSRKPWFSVYFYGVNRYVNRFNIIPIAKSPVHIDFYIVRTSRSCMFLGMRLYFVMSAFTYYVCSIVKKYLHCNTSVTCSVVVRVYKSHALVSLHIWGFDSQALHVFFFFFNVFIFCVLHYMLFFLLPDIYPLCAQQ